MQKQLSILVPAYNVENTLEKCIVSLEKQDIPADSYEVVIVNDGSTDNTLALANGLAEQYPNIRIISQENKKLSGARKTGVENASGEYLLFIDSDDYLRANCLSYLLDKMRTSQLDILAFDFEAVDMTGKSLPQKIRPQKPGPILSGTDFLFSKYMTNALWSNVFRRELFENKEIVLQEGINKAEDKLVTYQVFYYARKVQYIPNRLYYYVSNPQSICNTMSIHSFLDLLYVTRSLVLFAEQKVEQPDIQRKYLAHLKACTMDGFFLASWMIPSPSEYQLFYAKAQELQLIPIEGEVDLPGNLSELRKLFRKKKIVQNIKISINKYTYKLRQRKSKNK
jgi:glycosyltransferase involved in cell wall biosynthesis